MAAREKSIFRIALLSDSTTCACEDARASVDVLFFGQAGAIQGTGILHRIPKQM